MMSHPGPGSGSNTIPIAIITVPSTVIAIFNPIRPARRGSDSGKESFQSIKFG